jgi:hypothetical protein
MIKLSTRWFACEPMKPSYNICIVGYSPGAKVSTSNLCHLLSSPHTPIHTRVWNRDCMWVPNSKHICCTHNSTEAQNNTLQSDTTVPKATRRMWHTQHQYSCLPQQPRSSCVPMHKP